MKVFHLISHFDVGGAERVAASIAKSGSEDMEYHVVEIMRGNSSFTKNFIRELETAGVKCHRAWMPDIRFHFLFERISALLFPLWFLPMFLRYKPEVIHAHTELPDMCAVAFFRAFPWLRDRCRIVRTIHNTCLWTGQGRIGNIVETFYQKHAINIAISEGVAGKYIDVYGGAEPKIIYNGVEEVEQKTYEGLKKDRINIIFSGRFERQKGISTLIETITGMPNDSPYHFHIFGDGSMREEMEAALGGHENVTINPPLFALSSYLSSFDYMIMPSQFEGLSIVAIEASIAGLPNIISDIAGLRETLPEDWPLKVAGVEMSFSKILMEAIPHQSVEEGRKYSKLLGVRAQAYARCHFSVGKMRQDYEVIYRGIVPLVG